MARKRSRKKPAFAGTGTGHTAKTKVPDPVPFELPEQVHHNAQSAGAMIEPGSKFYKMGGCSIILSHSKHGWHMSIAHPKRYPTWDEIAHARYSLIPNDVPMAMMLPPQEEFINVHANCFQLWQVDPFGETVSVPHAAIALRDNES